MRLVQDLQSQKIWRGNLLKQLSFGTAALQMKHRVTEPLTGNILVFDLLGTRVTKDGVLGGVHCVHAHC